MKTKFLLILLVTLIFGLQIISAQENTENQIVRIRTEVAAINKNAGKYKKMRKSVEGISLEGTKAVFYSSGGALKKTTAELYGEMFKATAQIYYDGNMPIFIYQKMNKYDKPFNLSPKVSSTEEIRIYYANEQIIRILVGKKEIKSGDEKFEELKKEFQGFSDELLKAFKK